ncbi:MAG TPA: DEAD/DEAH box helicase family protein [Dehalococcoidia bacterium]|nr:DEAD/DEAH box helicase family protein [Dehalococcoidia bacterium]
MALGRLLPAYQVPAKQRESKALLVPAIRKAVHGWRVTGYEGATETSKRLLQHWFESDHKNKLGDEWHYYYCQREAIETLIYLYEVVKSRRLAALAENFDEQGRILLNPREDRFARYVFKMATGSGKTKVMSLAIVWSYFNAVFGGADYSKTFLVIAPNVIVYQRLLDDFGDGAIFHNDPLIPPEWESDWQFGVITRDDPGAPSAPGTLYLTNVHQLYESRDRRRAQEPDAMTAVLGPAPAADISTGEGLRERVRSHGDLLVINDEAHHVHDPELKWNEVISFFHDELRPTSGLMGQLDFTATPKDQRGALFREVVVDYPISQAIEDGIVKRPVLGELSGTIEYQAESAADRHRDKLNAGIQKWKQFQEQLKGSGKKPVLFVMTENTKAAGEIADWLRTQPEFPEGTVLRIDTNARGEISEAASKVKELQMLRTAAKDVDSDASPYSAIVSVLMLREGWDVRNVVVIVPLRAYSTKAQILPEQTLGRGLRRMWPMASGSDLEQVVVIEHQAFRSFWDKELKEEGLEIQWVPIDRLKPEVQTVLVDPTKSEFDIEIPKLTPAFSRSVAKLDALDLASLPVHAFQVMAIGEEKIGYLGRDMLTLEVVDEDEFDRDFPIDPIGYLNVLTRMVLREVHLSNVADGFAKVAPLIKRYIEQVMFGGIEMDDKRVMLRLNHGDTKTTLFKVFVEAINQLAVTEEVVRPAGEVIRVSEANPYPTTRPCVAAKRTVFDKVPCDSDLERGFAHWLDEAEDVLAFAKNEIAIHFDMEYVSEKGGLRSYRPDFLIRTPQGNYIIETKGWEDLEVARKDLRATQWCKDATDLSGESWQYLKVGESLFSGRQWRSIGELAASS